MRPPRWTSEHAVAAVEFVCGVVAVVWLSTLAIGSGSAFPGLLGLAVGGALLTSSVRRWRRANRTAPREAGRAPAPSPPERPLPDSSALDGSLSPDGERELDRVVAVLADAAVFAPRAPRPADLRAAVADWGEPVTVESVLMALHEAPFHEPASTRRRTPPTSPSTTPTGSSSPTCCARRSTTSCDSPAAGSTASRPPSS